MTAFERLTPALQYQIAYTLGFKQLRPVQELTIPAILDGKNCVVLAPTAGGKTEAAFFPILSAIDAGDWKPVSVLYLSPIRALLNNQEERVQRYAATIGRRAFKWHGDTSQSERKRFLREPADILLTTPESLEAMLMSPRVPARGLFGGLQAVIIDEVHAFADDDRGAHLSAVMERLSRYCGRDVQRIGLSATVGNPTEILEWLRGRSQRDGIVVEPPRPPRAPELALDFVGSIENAALVAAQLHRGKKRLIFVDSRRGVEDFGRNLIGHGVNTYVAHGSLSVAARRDAERAFAEGTDCAIVATSALELGIDVGDLDHVVQFNSPSSVASFLQRMGRTGRRAGTTANCTFLAATAPTLWQAAAIIALYRDGYVEPVSPSHRASHILAHQVMALAVQESGVPLASWWAWLDGATPFTGLAVEERQSIVDHMLAEKILDVQEGRFWLGPAGEKRYGRANFSELYAVFSTPRLISVMSNGEEVGTVDASFLKSIETEGPDKTAFALGGRPWRIVHIDWPRGVCTVRPAENARAPRWSGSPQFLDYALVQKMREVILSDDVDPSWSKRAVETMQGLRAEHAFLRALDDPAPMVSGPSEVTWWTFAGGRANALLARMIEAELGGKCTVRNASITCRDGAGKSVSALRDSVAQWQRETRPGRADALRFVSDSTRISKFQPCLPPALLAELTAVLTLDVAGAAAVVARAGAADAGAHLRRHR